MSKLQKFADKAKKSLKYRAILGADKVTLKKDKEIYEFLAYVDPKFVKQCRDLVLDVRDPITQLKVHEEMCQSTLEELQARTGIDEIFYEESKKVFRCTVKIRDVQIQRPIR